MTKSKNQTDISTMLANKFPELCQILEEERKLSQYGIRETEIYTIYNILNKNLLSTAIVLFLGFTHGDSYPLSSIADVFKGLDAKQITRVLQNLKDRGLVYIEKFGANWDFYALDRHFSTIGHQQLQPLFVCARLFRGFLFL